MWKKLIPFLLALSLLINFSISPSFAKPLDTDFSLSFEEASAPGGQYTDTGDPSTDHPLKNNPGEPPVNDPGTASSGGELGFSSEYINTRNDVGLTDGDYVGVTSYTGDVGSYPDGSQGFELSDCDGKVVTSVQAIDTSGATGTATVSIDYFVKSTGWETDDELRIWVVLDDTTEVDIINTAGSDIDDLGIEGSWHTGSVDIDLTNVNKLQLKFSLDSNSGSEAVYFDNIQITNVTPNAITFAGMNASHDLNNNVIIALLVGFSVLLFVGFWLRRRTTH